MAIIYGRAQTEKDLLDIAPAIVKKVEDIEIIHQELKNKLGEEKKDFFDKVPTKILEEEKALEKIKNDKKEKINEIKTFAAIEKSHIHVGAKGELRVLDKLSQLSNKYHILCGLNIGLDHYVTYNSQKNLRSAQMDFVVVSNKGVILLEVKNWSSKFYH